jgi:integrase
MACHVKVNQHGYLAYRLFWNGRRSWEGTALRDTPHNRARVDARATIMTEEIEAGTFDYLRWFPNGNLAHLFRPALGPVPEPPPIVTVRAYAEQTWLPRKVPPLVRASLADTYRSALRAHILPALGETTLADLTPMHLEDLKALMTRTVAKGGKGLKMKTAWDVIDGVLRALYRDARTIDRLVHDDPFKALRWPTKLDPEPDPFTAEERDRICAYFAEKDRHYHPLVVTMFWTGLRTGEAVGLRRGDFDLRRGQLLVRRSRTMGEDNPPKTKRSRRTLTLLPEVLVVLRTMPAPLHATDDAFLFTTMASTPLTQERFVEKHWHRALRGAGVRPRKFYATRHTFISQAVSTPGISLKWLADYCGTSIEMIERHYGRYMHGDESQLALLAGARSNVTNSVLPAAVDGVGGATLGATFRRPHARRSEKPIRSASRTSGGGEIRTRTARTATNPRKCAKTLVSQWVGIFWRICARTQNDPETPRIARQNPDRSGSASRADVGLWLKRPPHHEVEWDLPPWERRPPLHLGSRH